MMVNGGRRGLQVELAPADLVRPPGRDGGGDLLTLLRRLRGFGQVVERRDDVLGQRVGERRAFMRIAHQADVAVRQFRKTFGGGQHAHAGAQPRFREHRYRKTGEHRRGRPRRRSSWSRARDRAGRSSRASRSPCAATRRSGGRARAAAALPCASDAGSMSPTAGVRGGMFPKSRLPSQLVTMARSISLASMHSSRSTDGKQITESSTPG